jgi:hypothetical protein
MIDMKGDWCWYCMRVDFKRDEEKEVVVCELMEEREGWWW